MSEYLHERDGGQEAHIHHMRPDHPHERRPEAVGGDL
jgi:hypothetical protein